jgi:hypothetical protein
MTTYKNNKAANGISNCHSNSNKWHPNPKHGKLQVLGALNPDAFSAPPPQASGFHWLLIRIYTNQAGRQYSTHTTTKKNLQVPIASQPAKSLNLLESSVKLKNSSLPIIPGPHLLLF